MCAALRIVCLIIDNQAKVRGGMGLRGFNEEFLGDREQVREGGGAGGGGVRDQEEEVCHLAEK